MIICVSDQMHLCYFVQGMYGDALCCTYVQGVQGVCRGGVPGVHTTELFLIENPRGIAFTASVCYNPGCTELGGSVYMYMYIHYIHTLYTYIDTYIYTYPRSIAPWTGCIHTYIHQLT